MGTRVSEVARLVALIAAVGATNGCYSGLDRWAGEDPEADGDGGADDDGGGVADRVPGDPPPAFQDVPRTAVRRLAVAEYDATVRDLLGDLDLPSFELLPADTRTPFDNDYTGQISSEALVTAVDFLADEAATRLLEDTTARAELVGCTPQSPTDAVCMGAFVERFGRRALRRPLTSDEVQTILDGASGADGALAWAAEEGDFWVGVEFTLRVLLQDPEFLHRIEIGTPVAGVPDLVALGDWEIATRMALLVWGSGPDEELLDRAAAGQLVDAEEREAVLAWMLDDPRAHARIARFHAMWMGFEALPHDASLAVPMRVETDALIERVIFEEKAPWHELFHATETFIDDTMAEHYGLVPPGSAEPVWVPYGDSGRKGLLSHGSFLSQGAKFDDTSPVIRGISVLERLLCQDIPPPPPNVNADAEPVAVDGFCKEDRYAAHRSGGCSACHDSIDPIGFGLEQYDATGRFRTHEVDDPMTPEDESVCEIPGRGALLDAGEFQGPGELGELAITSGMLDECLVTQLHRFTIGRSELDESDAQVLERLREIVASGDFRFDDVLVAIVTDPTFAYRRIDAGEG